MTGRTVILGIISDTHGLLRPEAVEALRGSDRILHAGDVGTSEILESARANRARNRDPR
jgi:predicted phosphodiesterase